MCEPTDNRPAPPPVDHSTFSDACPRCGAAGARPAMQRNNFADTHRVGASVLGDGHLSTTRRYECQACGHAWDETVPFAG